MCLCYNFGMEEQPRTQLFSMDSYQDMVAPQKEMPKALRIVLIVLGFIIFFGVVGYLIVSAIANNANNAELSAQLDKIRERNRAFQKQYDDEFRKLSYSAYNLTADTKTDKSIYPNNDDYKTAKEQCLQRFDFEAQYHDFERQDEYSDLEAAIAKFEKINATYARANSGIEQCREVVLYPIENTFTIIKKRRDYTVKILENGERWAAFTQPVEIRYDGKRQISKVRIKYKLYNSEDGTEIRSAALDAHEIVIDGAELANSAVIKRDIFETNGARYMIKETESGSVWNGNLVINSISGKYAN